MKVALHAASVCAEAIKAGLWLLLLGWVLRSLDAHFWVWTAYWSYAASCVLVVLVDHAYDADGDGK